MESTKKGERRVMYDVVLGIKYSLDWFRHIMSGVQQEKAKSHVLINLDTESALWLKDWAQSVASSGAWH